METRCSCAARHTLHNAARGRKRLEHSGQRPRGSSAWAASRARHPWVRRGSSLRASDSSDPLSALLTSSSSMSSRSHTARWSTWPRIWSIALHLPAVQVPAVQAAYQQCPRHEALIAPSSTYKVWSRIKSRHGLGCADRPSYTGERPGLISRADQLRRSSLPARRRGRAWLVSLHTSPVGRQGGEAR